MMHDLFTMTSLCKARINVKPKFFLYKLTINYSLIFKKLTIKKI